MPSMKIDFNAAINFYQHLSGVSREKAQQFFSQRAAQRPHLAWMEGRFLGILDAVARNDIASQVDPTKIEAVDFKQPRYLEQLINFTEEHRTRLYGMGMEALQKGEAMAIDLVAGMATGFGGNVAKAVVPVVLDTRFAETHQISYLDVKFSRYLEIQKEYKKLFVAAEMVSEATIEDVIGNLNRFANEHSLELTIIMPGTPKAEIQKTWQENKDRWNEALVVAIIEQPTTLYIDSQGKEVGKEYMKGHGDFFDVVQSQLKDLVEVMGVRYLFSSNIDNTGALLDEEILGYFIEQVTQRRIQAIMEVAEKYEGDKGGAPALIDGVYSVLEGAFVPPEWKEAFAGRSVFPYFNTNTFWWLANPLMETEFSLPFMISKKERHEGSNLNWLKIESIMAHGLNQLNWKALAIDRGLRFHPAKFLSDLWVTRSDWMTLYEGRLIPRMCDGTWVRKPLMEISKSVIGKVEHVDNKLHAGGGLDFMAWLRSLIIGGIGKDNFNREGKYETLCRISYEGNVAIIFDSEPDKPAGSLVIKGKKPMDTLVLKDSVVYIPAGEHVTLESSLRNTADSRVSRPLLEHFIEEAVGSKWTKAQKEHVVNDLVARANMSTSVTEFGPFSAKYRKILDLAAISEQATKQLDKSHKIEMKILSQMFKIKGSLVYNVKFGPDQEDEEKSRPYLLVHEGSKLGLAVDYPSRADLEWVPARDEKASTIISDEEGLKIYINPVEKSKGGKFENTHYIAIPNVHRGKAEILLLLGEFDESYNSGKKEELFSYKLESLKRIAVEGREHSQELDQAIEKAFSRIPYADLFELSIPQLFEKHVKEKLPS